MNLFATGHKTDVAPTPQRLEKVLQRQFGFARAEFIFALQFARQLFDCGLAVAALPHERAERIEIDATRGRHLEKAVDEPDFPGIGPRNYQKNATFAFVPADNGIAGRSQRQKLAPRSGPVGRLFLGHAREV